jgi:hypothetical protein
MKRVKGAARGGMRGPTVVAARDVLAQHYRAGWLACEVLLAVALAVLMFWSADGTTYFFATAGIGLGLLGVVFAAVLAHEALRPQVRSLLVAAHGRAAFIRGLLLAAGSLRALVCLLVVGLAFAFGRISGTTARSLLAGTTGLIALCVLAAALTVTVSSPLTTRVERLGLLAVLDAALYSLANDGWLAAVLWAARLPLLPILACYEASVAGTLSWDWLGALLLAGAYVAGLAWLGERLLVRADQTQAQAADAATKSAST